MSESEPQTIWCDESGFTGNRLLDRKQPTFIYCSVAIEEAEALEVIDRIARDASVQGEVKASKLLRFNAGRKALVQAMEQLQGRFLISYFDKKFALAGKFFEYVFEPAVAEKSEFFYRIRFHKFVANLLYVHFVAQRRAAEDIFEEFEGAIRDLDESRLQRLLSEDTGLGEAAGLQPIVDFGILNFHAIASELDELRGEGVGKWVLDLTGTALYSHLGHWGHRFDSLEVFCDSSKPLLEGFPLDRLVGKREKIYINISGEEQLMTPNLAKPVHLVKSADYPGLQIADVLAGAAAKVFERDSNAEQLKPWILQSVSGGSVLPEPETYLNGKDSGFHTALLLELVRLSLSGKPLLEHLEEFLAGR